jgi:shikimate kinase
MRVYLTGFMGSGKTTVGSLLARRLGWTFVDLDAEVERAAGCSVREVFASRGEAAFRAFEHHALAATLAAEDVVVATGGGTLTFAANRELVGPRGFVVWLNASFDTIRRRIGALGKEDRPLFKDEGQAWSLYQERLPAYRGADATVDVGAADEPAEVASRIEMLLRSRA